MKKLKSRTFPLILFANQLLRTVLNRIYTPIRRYKAALYTAFPYIILKEIIERGGYKLKQVFNIDETGLYWNRMHTFKKLKYLRLVIRCLMNDL